MPGHFRPVRSDQRLAGGRGAGVYRLHSRHRGVEQCTGGNWELGSTEIQGIGTGNPAGGQSGARLQRARTVRLELPVVPSICHVRSIPRGPPGGDPAGAFAPECLVYKAIEICQASTQNA
jgi:hypothetical protein